MKKGQVYEGVVERVDFPNKGIVATEEGKQIVVKNAIPGQRISFVVNKVKRGRAEGRLMEVLEPSPLELTQAVCPRFGICGGCTYLNLPYEEQLKLKVNQVKRLLEPVCAPYCDLDSVFEGIKGSPLRYGYRNKMEFTFGDMEKDGPLTLGMHRRNSFYDIVTVTGCRIVDDDYSRILECVLEFFQEREMPYYHRMRHTGFLRHLLVRKAAKTGEILVDLVTTFALDEACDRETRESGIKGGSTDDCEFNRMRPNAPERDRMLAELAERLLTLNLDGKIVGILNTKNDSVADAVINQDTVILYGQDFFYEELLGLQFRISPFSFFQTNSLGAETLYETVREYVAESGNGKVIYDLYSGTGTIAQMLAPVAKKVIGVEIVPEAVEAARENAKRNGLPNCEFLAGDVLKVLDDIEEKPEFIVLDPPRDGMHPKALEKIGALMQVKKMIYISCKPTSLARDLAELQKYGYRVERACCVDMFPGTHHTETCVLLSRKKSGGKSTKIEIEIDLSEADRRKCIGKATYQEIKDYIWEHYQTKVSHLYIAQIKKKCGLDVGENFNKPKTEGNKVPNCPPEKERMIREALEYFGMINKE